MRLKGECWFRQGRPGQSAANGIVYDSLKGSASVAGYLLNLESEVTFEGESGSHGDIMMLDGGDVKM